MTTLMEKIKIMMLGALIGIGLVLLLGAGGGPQIGRYRLSASLNYVHIIDTATGQWKTYEYTANQNEPVLRSSGNF